MQIGTLLIVTFVLLLPIVTLYKRFDSLRKILFFSSGKIVLPKLNFSFALLTKSIAFVLFIAKFYLSLYTILYMATNHVLLSLLAGLILLGLLIVLIYIFWRLDPKWQNLIVHYSGFSLSIVVCCVLSGFFLISFYSITKNEIDLSFSIFAIFFKDIVLSAITAFIAYCVGTFVSNFYSVFEW